MYYSQERASSKILTTRLTFFTCYKEFFWGPEFFVKKPIQFFFQKNLIFKTLKLIKKYYNDVKIIIVTFESVVAGIII